MRYRGRRAVQLENERLRVTVLKEGGHLAEVLHKKTGINPLWTPPWRSIEPSSYDPDRHPEYGSDSESRLLAGIMGHNLCLGIFGPPSPEEAAFGLGTHGEASVVPYSIEVLGSQLVATATLSLLQLQVTRRIALEDDSESFRVSEQVTNLCQIDRPITWTQHVTLGPPFLERGSTRFRTAATRSRVYEGAGFEHCRYVRGADFDWPLVPAVGNSKEDLRTFTNARSSSGFSAHLMDLRREMVFFEAYSPATQLLFGYKWRRADFPWMGIWEENCSRTAPPWNGKTIARGMEFGVSPFPEPMRQVVARGSMFDVPVYRWLPAGSSLTVEYSAFIREERDFADDLPGAPIRS
jgi:hypothetical protein